MTRIPFKLYNGDAWEIPSLEYDLFMCICTKLMRALVLTIYNAAISVYQ